MQAYVAKIVNSNPVSVVHVPKVYLCFLRTNRGYIVMDFIQGTTLAQHKSPNRNYYNKDLKAVATTFQQLTDVKLPAGSAPGPIGGGCIGNNFFVNCLLELKYPTVECLEAQINEV